MNAMGPSKIYCNHRIAHALEGITVVPPGTHLAKTAHLMMPICPRQHKKVRVCPFVSPSIHPPIHPS